MEKLGVFFSLPAGISIENAAHLITRKGTDVLILVDATCHSFLKEGEWDFYPVEVLDTVCHTTHSVPLSLLACCWRNENPRLEIHFIGIRIEDTQLFAAPSPAVETARREIAAIFEAWLAR